MTSYTTVFGGNTIIPSYSSYSSLSFSSNQTLTWPLDTPSGSQVISQIIDLIPSTSGLSVALDDAREVSVGQTIVFNNKGSNAVTITTNDGVTIMSVSAGQIWTCYLTDNTTLGGTWTVYQNGAGTSSSNAASLAGYGVKAIGATLNQNMPIVSITSTYTTGSSDRASAIYWTGGAGALNLPAANLLGGDWFIHVRNSGSGTITVTPSGADTINGASTLSLATTDSCIIVCTGSTFFTVGLGRSVSSTFNVLSISVAGTGNYTLSGAELGQVGYKFTGILTGNRSIIVPNTIAQYWCDNSTTGAFTLTVKTAAGTGIIVPQSNRYILYCDGTNVVNAHTSTITSPVAIADGGTGATDAATARTNLGGSATGVSLFTAASASAARSTLSTPSVDETYSWATVLG